MALDFSNIIFRDGKEARLLPIDAWQIKCGDTRRRVMRVDGTHLPTTVLCDERGRCNQDHESPWDLVSS